MDNGWVVAPNRFTFKSATVSNVIKQNNQLKEKIRAGKLLGFLNKPMAFGAARTSAVR